MIDYTTTVFNDTVKRQKVQQHQQIRTDGGQLLNRELPPRPEEVLDEERIQFQALTDLSDSDYAALVEDILENGVLQPVIVDDSDEQVIIDGHHREAIAEFYDLSEEKRPAYVVVSGMDDDEKLSRAIKQNLIGRDTTDAVKSHAVKQYIELSWDRTDDGDLIRPETDTEVAEKLGVDQSLVSRVVNNMNAHIIYHDRVKAREYYKKNPDASYRDVAEQVDTSRPTVTEWLKEDFDEGEEQSFTIKRFDSVEDYSPSPPEVNLTEVASGVSWGGLVDNSEFALNFGDSEVSRGLIDWEDELRRQGRKFRGGDHL